MIKDTIGRATVSIDGKEVNSFDYLINGSRFHNTSPLILFVKAKKFKLVELFLEACIEEEVHGKLNVNFTVHNGFTFLNIVDTLIGKDVENIHYIWKKFH